MGVGRCKGKCEQLQLLQKISKAVLTLLMSYSLKEQKKGLGYLDVQRYDPTVLIISYI